MFLAAGSSSFFCTFLAPLLDALLPDEALGLLAKIFLARGRSSELSD